MKRFLLAMAALLTIAGCAQQEELVSADLGATNAPEFGVGIETSRVAVAEDGENYVMSWAADDRVSVFFNAGGNSEYKFTGETGATSGVIKAVNAPQGELLPNYYAIYPYAEGNTLAGDVLSFTLPAEQQYIPNTFAPGVNTMVATTTDEIKSNFSFSNVCGYLRLKVYGDATIKSIKVEGNNGEIIAGAATYDMANDKLTVTGDGKTITLVAEDGIKVGATAEEATSFWFVIPASTFEKGFRTTITDVKGYTSFKNLIDEYEVIRNNVEVAELEIDIDLGFDGAIFDAKFNDDGTATDAGKYKFEIQTIEGEFLSVVQDGDWGNVAKFTQGPTNSPQNNSYYYVDYSADNETNNAFKADINDGFTMEVVASCGELSTDPWAYMVSGNSFGLLHTSVLHYARIMGCGDGNKNNQFSNMTEGNGHDPHAFRVDKDKYHHYVYIWNPVHKHIKLYVDGILYTEGVNWGVDAGHRLAIGGYPAYVDDAPEIRMPYDGKIAVARIYSEPMTEVQIKARAKELNFQDNSVVEPGNVLLDAKFEGITATNVGTMQSLVIDNSLLGTSVVTAVKRGSNDLVKFSRSEKNNNATPEGAYLIDYTSNTEFKTTLTNGFTMEVLCKVDYYAGDFWSKVMAGTCYGIQNDRVDTASNLPSWGLFANAREDKWTTAPSGGWQWGWTRYVTMNSFEHLLYAYDSETRITTFYLNGEFLYQVSYGTDFNAGNMLAIGALPYNNKTFFHPFVGEIAVARVYDNKCNGNWAKARYNELLPTIQELNSASAIEMPAPMVDVRFNTNDTATDVAGNYAIETVMNENTLSVVSPTSDYKLNNIARFRPITDENGTPITASYFKLSYENLPELQQAMDDGLSIEVIYRSVNKPYDPWQGLYGNEVIRQCALGWHWGGGWTIHLSHADGTFNYKGDSSYKPNRTEEYHHNIFIRNNETKDYTMYTDGVLDYYRVYEEVNTTSTTMAIGAAYDAGLVLTYHWMGDIALFRIYDEPLTRAQAEAAYLNVQDQIKALNESSFIK